MTEISDAEIVEESTAIAVVEAPTTHALNLFGAADPVAVIDAAKRVAEPLARLVKERQLVVSIRGRDHVRVEGWTLLGSMLGVYPAVTGTEKVSDDEGVWKEPVIEMVERRNAEGKKYTERVVRAVGRGGYKSRVEARTSAGTLVGAAEAECRWSEPTWEARDAYALLSMSQTRATSKALRLPLGFVMQLGGFDPTPAEEMSGEGAPLLKCPHCGKQSVEDNRTTRSDENQPAFRCTNRSCGGGGPKKKGDGRWPWASWEANEYDGIRADPEGGDWFGKVTTKLAPLVGGDLDAAVGQVTAAMALLKIPEMVTNEDANRVWRACLHAAEEDARVKQMGKEATDTHVLLELLERHAIGDVSWLTGTVETLEGNTRLICELLTKTGLVPVPFDPGPDLLHRLLEEFGEKDEKVRADEKVVRPITHYGHLRTKEHKQRFAGAVVGYAQKRLETPDE